MTPEDIITSKWAIGFHDRGLGHGDYGVIVAQTEEEIERCDAPTLVLPKLSRELAEHIVEAHNKTV